MLPLPALGPAAYITLLALLAPAALMALWRRRGARRLGGGTHVLITGGSKGLGLALARLCVQRGCSVTVVARSQPDLDAALQQLREAAQAGGAEHAGQRLQALSADTADPDKVGLCGLLDTSGNRSRYPAERLGMSMCSRCAAGLWVRLGLPLLACTM